MLTETDWARRDARYVHQAEWSRALRAHLLRRLNSRKPLRILEVGCGTGAVLRSPDWTSGGPVGLLSGVDKDPGALRFCAQSGNTVLSRAMGEELPFASDSFDLVCCHYLLLWTGDPLTVVKEMRRVTVPGGICAAMAEPSYAEMEAEPDDLKVMAEQQRQRLADAGADLRIGMELGELFRKAGFDRIEWNRYQTLPLDEAGLREEIRQMREDCDDPSFCLKTGVQYSYNVPTYYAFAAK